MKKDGEKLINAWGASQCQLVLSALKPWKEGLSLFFFFWPKKKIDLISEPFIFFPWSLLLSALQVVRLVIELF